MEVDRVFITNFPPSVNEVQSDRFLGSSNGTRTRFYKLLAPFSAMRSTAIDF